MAEAAPGRLRRLGAVVRDAATRNVPLKAFALVLACGLWMFVNFGERDTEEALKVPVQFRNIPAKLMITSPRVDFIDVRVVGPRTLLGRIEPTRLAIPLDFDGARSGPAFFTVNVDRLDLPRGVRVVRVTPAQVTVTLERVRRKTVPVQLRVDGAPPEDFRVVSTTLTPEIIEISGPESQIGPIQSVATDPLVLDDTAQASLRQEVPLEPLGEYVTPRPGSVRAEIEIEEVRVEREFAEVPVSVDGDAAAEHVVDPTYVRVVVRGPRRVVDLIEPDGLVRVDVAGVAPGEHTIAIGVAVPDEADLVSVEPGSVKVTISAPAPPPLTMSSEALGLIPLAPPPTQEEDE
jgi:YbbR domain-containing protein